MCSRIMSGARLRRTLCPGRSVRPALMQDSLERNRGKIGHATRILHGGNNWR